MNFIPVAYHSLCLVCIDWEIPFLTEMKALGLTSITLNLTVISLKCDFNLIPHAT